MDLSPKTLAYLAWFTAILSVSGSLFFSEFYNFTPCILCWYQRIAMYPLVLILAVGILKKDKFLHLYVLPFSIIGMIISFYHNLLYFNFISEKLSPCAVGVSCTAKFIHVLGLDIPQLSFLSFTFITICMILFKSKKA